MPSTRHMSINLGASRKFEFEHVFIQGFVLHYAHPCHLISYDMRISAYFIGRANGNLRDLFTVSMVTNWHPLVRSVFIRTTTFWVAWQNCAWKHSKNSIEQQCKREIFVIFYARSFTFYLSLNGLCKAHFSRSQFLPLVKGVVCQEL